MRITALLMHRSLGRTAFPAFVVLILLNTLLRSMAWRHEWMWAVYQYNFTVMLLGPLLAGVAGWEGYRLARARSFLTSHQRPVAMLSAAWGALFAWCTAAFALGLLIVLAVVAFSGTPVVIGLPEVVTPLPALGLLALECAAGLVAGWLARSKLVAPLAAVTVFLASLLLYAGDLSAFVTVGGATGSLIGLRPKLGTQASQVIFYCLATVLAVALGAWLATWYRSPRWPVIVLAAVLSLGSAVYLATRSPLYLEARPGDVVCSGSHPQVCLGRSYEHFEPHVRKNLAPYVQAVESIGLRAPASFQQGAQSSSPNAGELSLDTITGSKEPLLDAFLGTYYGSRCELIPGSAVEKDYSNARYWLAQAVGDTTEDDPVVDPALVKGTPKQRENIVRSAFRGLMACHG
ncbi:hypothetical protein AQJ43_36785 [Streptomyces avermitilis]|uniref:Uncharacterized protein n=2 Tax=Streptomyces avermitilis TaxID=33903 RepID=A0A143T250_STRAW|nr:hypothetical protein [Streptomyces avermitilis]KUN48307.1 hypothetical protein AQJ43_36785 [Streptomyces avermitilis]BAU77482.1 hypothetical protein SAVERM_2p038 [Streptomyces avermitilis MA-4680 = NBRC 14893]BBJ56301.1 hypothetical protein SAVMC3_89300 [Streptomyces avermitilis]GDY70152.1 hypothetical protein SAV14893_095450 [Streptomyces avermitilis]GDY80449.1 hypothetical protein SAV31267_099340 [Streptomyces avermitilis]